MCETSNVNLCQVLGDTNNGNDILLNCGETNYIISFFPISDNYLIITNFINEFEIINDETITEILNRKEFMSFFKELNLKNVKMSFYENSIHSTVKKIIDEALDNIGVTSFYKNNYLSHYFKNNIETFLLEIKTSVVGLKINQKPKTFKEELKKEELYSKIYMIAEKESKIKKETHEREEKKMLNNNKEKIMEEEKKEENNTDSMSREEAVKILMDGRSITNKEFNKECYLSYSKTNGLITSYVINNNEDDEIFEIYEEEQNKIWQLISSHSSGWEIYYKPIYEYQFLYKNGEYYETTSFFENDSQVVENYEVSPNSEIEKILKSKRLKKQI